MSYPSIVNTLRALSVDATYVGLVGITTGASGCGGVISSSPPLPYSDTLNVVDTFSTSKLAATPPRDATIFSIEITGSPTASALKVSVTKAPSSL